jgi:ABC-2 type transport system ATP-binding protein
MNAIEIHGLSKSFGTRRAVDNLELAIPQGSLCGLIGPNGAGKTTSIRMIMSIIFPDAGTLRVLGKDSAVESKDRIGYLPEERGIYRKMKVGAFLTYMAGLKGMDPAGLDKKVGEWLERVGLADCIKKKCEELSKGMQQKVQFLTTIMHSPDLIILDEPFSGLDPVNAKLLRELVLEQHRAGRTIIFSTHQMFHAETLCDRVVMIHRGKKVLDAAPREIRSRFASRLLLAEALDPTSFPASERERIAGLEGVESVRESGHELEITAEDGRAAELLPRIASSGVLRRVEVHQPSLEDVFVEIVLGSDHAGAGQDEAAEREALRNLLRAGNNAESEPAAATAGRSRGSGGD